MSTTVSVVYHSGMGHTKMMAEAVAKGAGSVEGVDVTVIAIEGKDIVDGRWKNDDVLERLDLFHRLGLRVMQLTYNARNFLGDGCLEPDDGGLSGLGARAVARMNQLGIAIDLSHVGERTTLMAIEASTKPVLGTHANAKALADWPPGRLEKLDSFA